MIKIKNKKVYKKLVKDFKEINEGKTRDEIELNKHLQNQKDRLIFYPIYWILFSMILLVSLLYWWFTK